MSGTVVNQIPEEGRQVIRSYGEGRFRISDAVHAGSVVVHPDRTIEWDVDAPEAITVDSLEPALVGAPRILLVGCGAMSVMPPEGLREALRARGTVLEWMDTGSACRTFNILLSEDRPVAAALIAVT